MSLPDEVKPGFIAI